MLTVKWVTEWQAVLVALRPLRGIVTCQLQF